MTTSQGAISVLTSSGTVRGHEAQGICTFLGIPFAAPPVGLLRFQAPEPPERWEGTREADVFGPPPPQMPIADSEMPSSGPTRRHNADEWLTVNVWTPDPGARGLPVMVYIYGGGYRAGSSSSPDINGRKLAQSGVVVVTANHRVGMEGYASLGGAPENRALLDQIELLRWVQENISKFGGESHAVTIFGESAGAGAVANLLVAPAARGLFTRAIAQSCPCIYLTRELARDIARELVSPLGLLPTAAALCDVSPDALAEAGLALDARMGPIYGRAGELATRWGPMAGTVTAFSPVVDGDALPLDPLSALQAGVAKDVSLLIGHTRDEWRLFLAMTGLAGQIVDEDAEWALDTFGPQPGGAQAVRATYPDATPEDLFTIVQSDWLLRMPSLKLAQAQAGGGGKAHLYELTYSAPASNGALGACHYLDVPLVFGNLEAAPDLFGERPPEESAEMSRLLQASWTAFAAEGDPGWAAFSDPERLTGVFASGAGPQQLPYPEERARKLWSAHQFEVLQLHS
ncbi:carboxylesterase/lipase family protein [Leifsonia sp. McL0608]|uniref:carboxylesterase/lipase family protein n=1 Tax=Leifsonia sp. McL0608 TaxID=3143537 RepID=UPI003D9C1176